MGLMTGKRGLVVGIVNDYSFAHSITRSLMREGAECLFTHLPGEKMERRVRKAVESLGVTTPWLQPMDAGSDEDLDRVRGQRLVAHGQVCGDAARRVHASARHLGLHLHGDG